MKVKRILALLLALMMSLSLVACGGDSGETTSDGDTDAATEDEVSLDASDVTTESGRPAITMWFWGAATDYQLAMKDILCGWYNNSQDQLSSSLSSATPSTWTSRAPWLRALLPISSTPLVRPISVPIRMRIWF